MQRIPSKTGPLDSNRYADNFGHTADELRPEKAVALPAEIAPLASRELHDLLGTTRGSDQIRLDVPKSASPFLNTQNGKKHDYFLLQSLVRKSNSEVSKELVSQLQDKALGISPKDVGFMRASLAREHSMLELLRDLTDSMGTVHNRIVGSQEG